MKKGTTPIQTIKVKRNLTTALQVLVIFNQNKRIALAYEADPDTIEYDSTEQKSTISFKISQKEMQRLNAGYCNIEVNALFADDEVYKSDVALVRITPSLNGIIMEEDDDE